MLTLIVHGTNATTGVWQTLAQPQIIRHAGNLSALVKPGLDSVTHRMKCGLSYAGDKLYYTGCVRTALQPFIL